MNETDRARLASNLLNDTAPPNYYQHNTMSLNTPVITGPHTIPTNPQQVFDLVEECNSFLVEVGGDVFKGLGLVQDVSERKMMKLNSIGVLEKMYVNNYLAKEIEDNNNDPFTIEYQDWGARYYRYYFRSQDHANYLGSKYTDT